MADLSHKQQEAVEHPAAMAIYDYLRKQELPTTIGTIVTECRGPSEKEYAWASVFRFVARMVEVGLVEKVAGTNLYRAVER